MANGSVGDVVEHDDVFLRLAITLPIVIIVGGLAMLTLYAASIPTVDFFSFLPIAAGWVIAGVLWFALLLVSAFRHDSRHALVRWAVPPVVVVAVASLVYVGVPDRVRFWLSESSLDRAADRFERGGTVGSHVGYYGIEDVSKEGSATVFNLGYGGIFAKFVLVRGKGDVGGANCTRLNSRWRECWISL